MPYTVLSTIIGEPQCRSQFSMNFVDAQYIVVHSTAHVDLPALSVILETAYTINEPSHPTFPHSQFHIPLQSFLC
jgi:hypothetical protein